MGSFQQIAISIVCLGIAFGFGVYVNTHPSGPESEKIDLAQQNAFDQKSNEAIQDLAFVEKRPAKMGMMRRPLKPRLDLPNNSFEGNSITEPPALPAPSDLGLRREDQSPPSPSSSDSNAVGDPTVSLLEKIGTPGIAQENDVPDFADAADAFTKMQPSPKSPRQAFSNRTRNSMEQEGSNLIANETSRQPSVRQNIVQSVPSTPLSEPLDSPTIEPFESTFTANDFEPQLLGAPRESTKIKSLTQPPTALAESTLRQQEELANTATGNSPPINLTFNIEELPEVDIRRRIPFKLNTARTEELKDIRARSQSYNDFQEHVVRNNESLQSISTAYFGKPDFYLDIYLANRQNLLSPVGIKPGTKLRIPTIK